MPVRQLTPDENARIGPTTNFATEVQTPKARPLTSEENQNLVIPGSMVGPMGAVESPSEAMKLGQESLEIGKQNKLKKQNHLKSVLGDRYDPEDFDAENSFLAQADIARSITLTDKQRKWQQEWYPNGDLISVPSPDGPILLGRESQDKPYREIGFGETMAGAAISEPLALGAAGSVFGPIGTGIGTLAGSLVQQGVEKSRGYGEGYGFGGSLVEALFAAGLDFAFRGFSRSVAGSPKSIGEARSLMQAAKAVEELGLEPIAIGQVGGPLQRGIFTQIGKTSKQISNKIVKQQEALLDSFRNRIDKMARTLAGADESLEDIPDDVLLNVVRAQQEELRRILQPMNIRKKGMGEAIQKGLKTWKEATKRLRDRYYKHANELADDVIMDLSPAKKAASILDLGTPTMTKSGEAVDLTGGLKGEVKEVAEMLLNLPDSISKITVRRIDELPSPQALLGEAPIEAEFTAFDQIKALRTRLFDLMHEGEGSVRRNATILWKAMAEVMDNPVSGNPDFVKAYQKASAFNKLREDTLDLGYIGQALTQDTPEQIAKKYIQPWRGSELEKIKSLVPKPRWEEFKSGYITDITSSRTAQQGLTKLQQLQLNDPDTLRVIMSETEERDLEKFLIQRLKFESSPAGKMLKKNLTEGEKFVAMAKEGTAGDVRDAIRLSGGKESEYAEAAKLGIYKDILDNSMARTEYGEDVLSPHLMLDRIDFWKKSGKLDEIFTEQDWSILKRYEHYGGVLTLSADVGGGMMAGGLRQKLVQLPSELARPGGTTRIAVHLIRPLVSNEIMAYFLTRKAIMHRLYLGNKAAVPLSNLNAAMGIALAQYQKQKPRKTGVMSPEAKEPVYHTGGIVKDYGKIAANLDKMPNLQREKQLRHMFKNNRKEFDRLMAHLENGNS